MICKTTDLASNIKTILASDTYQAVPIKLTESLKAGTPIKNDGSKAADGKQAIGILLYDVNKDENPNGAVVVSGIIDYQKAKASANTDLTAEVDALAEAIPNLIFRDKDGKTHTGTSKAQE